MVQLPDDSQTIQSLGLLADPVQYVACGVNLGQEARRRAYWIELFRNHIPLLLEEAMADAASRGLDQTSVRERCRQVNQEFCLYLSQIEHEPLKFGRLDILAICHQRERVLRQFGFDDPYRLIKANQNASALALLPSVLAELSDLHVAELPAKLIEGIFAGNIFDLGVGPTLELFKTGKLDFYNSRDKLKPRPWHVDCLELWQDRWFNHPPHRCALLFVDNAGVDIVLGMIPFARCLLQRGTDVILSANSSPSLNDITHSELESLVCEIALWDQPIAQALDNGRLVLVPSGNKTPLIDLTACSTQLVQAADHRGVDLVVLEGMGRALESNYDAALTCDTIKIAMIKDAGVAQVHDAEIFDLVFRFDAASASVGSVRVLK